MRQRFRNVAAAIVLLLLKMTVTGADVAPAPAGDGYSGDVVVVELAHIDLAKGHHHLGSLVVVVCRNGLNVGT